MNQEQKIALAAEIGVWMLTHDTGMSSVSIARRALGIEHRQGYWTPADVGDFGRCYDMLKACPSASIECMRGASTKWNKLVDGWPRLTAQYESSRNYWGFDKLLAEVLG